MVEINSVFLEDLLDRIKNIENHVSEIKSDVMKLKTNKSDFFKGLVIIGSIVTTSIALYAVLG